MNARLAKLLEVKTGCAELAAEMYATGVRIDRAERDRLSKELKALSIGRKAAVTKAVDDPKFEYTPDGFRALIFERHAKKGHRNFNIPDPPPPSRNKHDGWTNELAEKCSVDKPALLRILIHPATPEELKVIIERWWRYRAPLKARATYITSSRVTELITADWRYHPGWNSCATETMRWAGGMIMTLSEKKEGGEGGDLRGDLPDLRGMFCEEPGWTIVGADWSQQELRMWQAITGDPALLKALATGDVYSFDARDWYNLPPDFDVKKEKPAARKSCKIGHLACQYLAGFGAVFQQALIQDRKSTFTHMRHIYGRFHQTYEYGVRKLNEEHQLACALGYSEGRLLGNRRYYPEEPPPTETANFPVQDTCGEMASIAMLNVRAKLKKYVPTARLMINLHDAFYVRSREKDKKTVGSILKEEMEGPWVINGKQIAFPVDLKEGRRWSDEADTAKKGKNVYPDSLRALMV